MRTYIDDGEKKVASLGGAYSPGVKKAPASLELTDRRLYYSTSGVVSTEDKAMKMTSTVIDAADISAITYTFAAPRGKFALGIIVMILSIIGGIVLAFLPIMLGETTFEKLLEQPAGLFLPVGIAFSIGVAAIVLNYVITFLIARKHRATTVTIEYRGIIFSAVFVGVSDEKLDEFRQWTFRVKDKLCDRKTPPTPESSTQMASDVEQL